MLFLRSGPYNLGSPDRSGRADEREEADPIEQPGPSPLRCVGNAGGGFVHSFDARRQCPARGNSCVNVVPSRGAIDEACCIRPCAARGSLAKRERGREARTVQHADTDGKGIGEALRASELFIIDLAISHAGRSTKGRRPRHTVAKPSTHWHATPWRASFRPDGGETAAMWHLSDTPCMGQAPSIFYKAIHHPSPQGQRSAEPRCAWAPLSSRMARGTLISRDSFLPHEMPEHWSIDLT